MPRDAAFDATLRTYAQAAMRHDAAGMRRGYIELRAVFRGAKAVPAYKQRRLERERRPRIRIVGDVGEKAARAMQALQVMVASRLKDRGRS